MVEEKSTTQNHEVGVVVDKLRSEILEHLDAMNNSGGNQADDELQATGGH